MACATPFAHRLGGGLSVLNKSNYYLAAELLQLAMLHPTSDVPLWVFLEIPNCAPVLVLALLRLPPPVALLWLIACAFYLRSGPSPT